MGMYALGKAPLRRARWLRFRLVLSAGAARNLGHLEYGPVQRSHTLRREVLIDNLHGRSS